MAVTAHFETWTTRAFSEFSRRPKPSLLAEAARPSIHGFQMKFYLVLFTILAASLAVTVLALYGVEFKSSEDVARAPAFVPTIPEERADSVVMLGASLFARGNWIEELERRWRLCNGRAVVTRLAKPGANSAWGLAALSEHLAQNEPDLVVVAFAGNDASLWRGYPLLVSRYYHARIVELSRRHGAQVVLATMNPAWESEALERPGQLSYRDMYRRLAAEFSLPLIDTTPSWLELDTATRTDWVPDNLHPGDQAMLHLTVPQFEKALLPFVCPAAQ